jgi:hypothetical protein
VVAYLLRSKLPALSIVNNTQITPEASGFMKWRTLWVGLAAMILIVPVGLLAPGTAWGEWGTEELSSLGLAFIPQGLAKLSGLWSAPLPDYDLPALGNANLAYILSALVGIVIVVVVVWLFSMLVTVKKPVAE